MHYGTHGIRIFLAIIVALLIGFNAPHVNSAQAATRKTEVVCLLKDYGLNKSWSKGLSKAANKQFKTKVKVKWIREDHWSNCTTLVWGDDTAYDYGNDIPVESRYSVSYDDAHNTTMINVVNSIPKKDRVPTLIKALKEAGVK